MEEIIIFGSALALCSFVILVIKNKFGWFDLSNGRAVVHTLWQAPLVIYILIQVMLIFDGEFNPFLIHPWGVLIFMLIYGTLALFLVIIYINLLDKFILKKTKSLFKYLILFLAAFPIAYILPYVLDYILDYIV